VPPKFISSLDIDRSQCGRLEGSEPERSICFPEAVSSDSQEVPGGIVAKIERSMAAFSRDRTFTEPEGK
jgi:hypothetical protein